MPVSSISYPGVIDVLEGKLSTILFFPEDKANLDYSNMTGPEKINNISEIISDFRFYDTPFRLNVFLSVI